MLIVRIPSNVVLSYLFYILLYLFLLKFTFVYMISKIIEYIYIYIYISDYYAGKWLYIKAFTFNKLWVIWGAESKFISIPSFLFTVAGYGGLL